MKPSLFRNLNKQQLCFSVIEKAGGTTSPLEIELEESTGQKVRHRGQKSAFRLCTQSRREKSTYLNIIDHCDSEVLRKGISGNSTN